MKFEKCEVCDVKFHDVGTLLGRKRLIHHRRIEHRAECENYGKRFVSTTHVAVHKFLSHDIICGRCGEACEGNCLELIASEIEKAGEERNGNCAEKTERQNKRLGGINNESFFRSH